MAALSPGGLAAAVRTAGLALLLASPAAASVSARDDLGERVVLPRPAARVVALAPSAVELLYAAGGKYALKAVCAEADYPAEARGLPRVGSFSNPDAEAILALKPDLVVMAHGNPKELIDRLRERGTAVYVCHAKRVADIPSALRGLGALVGRAEGGEKAARAFEKRLAALARRLRGRAPVPAAVMIWDDPITLAGAGAFLHDALRLAGGVNIAGDLPQPYPTMDPEQLVVRNPRVILFAGHDHRKVDEVRGRPGIRSTLAAKSGRVVGVHEDLTMRPGPRLIVGIEEMARALHPGL